MCLYIGNVYFGQGAFTPPTTNSEGDFVSAASQKRGRVWSDGRSLSTTTLRIPHP
jgi:hypothetical protein